MEPITPSKDFWDWVDKIIAGNAKNNYRAQLYDRMRLHAGGDKMLLRQKLQAKYPGEPAHITAYRLANATESTRKYYIKIFMLLNQLQLSTQVTGNQLNQKLIDYINSYFEGDIVAWMYNHFLNLMLQDANAIFLFIPYLLESQELTDRFAHSQHSFTPIMLNSHQVLHISNSSLLIFFQNYYHYFDEYQYLIFGKDNEGKWEVTYNFINPRGQVLATNTGGVHISGTLCESFLTGMIADLDNALIDDNDIRHVKKQFVYPEKWRIKLNKCQHCRGTGRVKYTSEKYPNGIMQNCEKCKGEGEASGVFSEHVLDLNQAGDLKQSSGIEIKPPFIGYVEKNLEIIKVMRDEYNTLVRNALAAVNMEFIADSQLNQSGAAKEMDRSELKAFLRVIATHMHKKIEEVCFLTLRTFFVSETEDETENYLAAKAAMNSIHVVVEEDFSYLLDNQKDFYVDPKQSAIDGLRKKYKNNLAAGELEVAIVELDELYGLANSDKLAMIDKGVLSARDVQLSLKLRNLVTELAQESSLFLRKTTEEKRKLLITRFNERYPEQPVPVPAPTTASQA